VASDILFKVPL